MFSLTRNNDISDLPAPQVRESRIFRSKLQRFSDLPMPQVRKDRKICLSVARPSCSASSVVPMRRAVFNRAGPSSLTALTADAMYTVISIPGRVETDLCLECRPHRHLGATAQMRPEFYACSLVRKGIVVSCKPLRGDRSHHIADVPVRQNESDKIQTHDVSARAGHVDVIEARRFKGGQVTHETVAGRSWFDWIRFHRARAFGACMRDCRVYQQRRDALATKLTVREKARQRPNLSGF
jgi:hypothetical protein